MKVELTTKILYNLASAWIDSGLSPTWDGPSLVATHTRLVGSTHTRSHGLVNLLVLFGHCDDRGALSFLKWIGEEVNAKILIGKPSDTEYFIEFENDSDATVFLLRWS